LTSDSSTPHRVLVAGAGVAGLEALLALRDLAGHRVAPTLPEPERELTYRPMAVGVPDPVQGDPPMAARAPRVRVALTSHGHWRQS
jgi:hypothetical protein